MNRGDAEIVKLLKGPLGLSTLLRKLLPSGSAAMVGNFPQKLRPAVMNSNCSGKGSAMTKTKIVIEYLLAHGYQELPSKTSKYRAFKKLYEGKELYRFVGKSAGVRGNSKPTVTDSYSLTDALMPRIMNWYNERGN